MAMLEINANPVITSLGWFDVTWDFFMMAAAAILALAALFIVMYPLKLETRHIIIMVLLLAIGGIIVGRLHLVFEHWLFFQQPGQLIDPSLRASGFILGVFLACTIYIRSVHIPYWQIADRGIPCLLLFFAIYRIGCVLVGCCYGFPSEILPAVIYTNTATYAPQNMALYPTQIGHLLSAAVPFCLALFMRKRMQVNGVICLVTLMVYAFGDFAVRLFRADEPRLSGITISQVIDICIFAAAAYLLYVLVSHRLQGKNGD